jgi:translation initiation factor 1A
LISFFWRKVITTPDFLETKKKEMPNYKGGKKYKSSKGEETVAEFHEIDAKQGQSVARVLKKLGNRNFLMWCNDGKERIAHVRGVLKKKRVWIEIGDIVLYSERGDNLDLTLESKSTDRGDILAKYDRAVYSQLKKYPGVNPKLFTNIESLDTAQRAAGAEDDFGFTFEVADEEEKSSEEDSEEGEDAKRERTAKKVEADKKRSAARSTKMSSAVGGGKDDGEVDIDAI